MKDNSNPYLNFSNLDNQASKTAKELMSIITNIEYIYRVTF